MRVLILEEVCLGQELRNSWEGPGELMVTMKLERHSHQNLASPPPANPFSGILLDALTCTEVFL